MLLTDKAYKAKFGGKLHSQACCLYNHSIGLRELVFRKKYLNMDSIAHELTHAYLSYRYTQSMTYSQVEEAVCEEMGKNLQRMANIAKRIYRELR